MSNQRKLTRLLTTLSEQRGGNFNTADLTAAFRMVKADVEIPQHGQLRIKHGALDAPFSHVGQTIYIPAGLHTLALIAKELLSTKTADTAEQNPTVPAAITEAQTDIGPSQAM